MSLVGNASRKDDPSPWIAPGQCGNFDHALRIVVQGDLAPVLRDVDVNSPAEHDDAGNVFGQRRLRKTIFQHHEQLGSKR